jgi:hypothetical protein
MAVFGLGLLYVWLRGWWFGGVVMFLVFVACCAMTARGNAVFDTRAWVVALTISAAVAFLPMAVWRAARSRV